MLALWQVPVPTAVNVPLVDRNLLSSSVPVRPTVAPIYRKKCKKEGMGG